MCENAAFTQTETHKKQHLQSNQVHILYSMEYHKPLALVNTTDAFQLVSQNTISIRLHLIKNPQRASVVMTHAQAATSTNSQHNDELCSPLLFPLLPTVYTTSALSKNGDRATYCGIVLLCLHLWSGKDLALCCCVYICDLEKTWLNHKWHHSKWEWVSTDSCKSHTSSLFELQS